MRRLRTPGLAGFAAWARGRARVLVAGLAALAATTAAASPLFENDEVLAVRLSGPFSSLVDRREESDRNYLPFRVEVGDERLPLQIRVRGHSRVRVCEFPPLRLKFDEPGPGIPVFAGQDGVKLVTHCRHQDRAEQDLLEEFLAYRIFNRLTQSSFRVRLLRIDYVDTDGRLPGKASPRYGFLIEPTAELAGRLGGHRVERETFPRYRHDRGQAALVSVFQYLVANTDWSLVKADGDESCCHNIRLLEVDSQLRMIPYDFDLTGLVNAPYAFPDPSLRLRGVTSRRYRGLCTETGLLREAIRRVNGQKAEILAMPFEVPGLSPRNAKRAAQFLEGFFERAEDEDRLVRNFESQCL